MSVKIQYKVSPHCTIAVDGADTARIWFEALADVCEIMSLAKCGNCQSTNVHPCVRRPQDYTYFSMKCDDCEHELDIGQNKEGGGLFPKGGWDKWQPKSENRQSDYSQGRPSDWDSLDSKPDPSKMTQRSKQHHVPVGDDDIPF